MLSCGSWFSGCLIVSGGCVCLFIASSWDLDSPSLEEPTFYSWVTKLHCRLLWSALVLKGLSLSALPRWKSWRSSDRVKMASATHWFATHSFWRFFAKPIIILFGYFFQVLLWRLWSFVLLWFLSEIFIKNTFGEFHPLARWGCRALSSSCSRVL